MDPIMKAYVEPTPGDVHVNRPLTDLSIAYMQSQEAFIARRAWPIVSVSKQSNLYWQYDRGEFNRDAMEKRAPGAQTAGITHALSTDPYFCQVWGLHEDLADQVRANQDDPLSMDQDAVDIISRAGMIRFEREFSAVCFKDNVWALQVQGGAARSANFDPASAVAANRNLDYWSDADSTPVEDIEELRIEVLRRTGYKPNILTIGPEVYSKLKNHPDIIGRINRGQTTGAAMVNKATLAELFEVEEVQVMEAIYNTSVEGADTTTDFVNAKNGLLHYRAPRPGWKVPSSGYIFVWTGYAGAPAEGARMKRFRMEANSSDRVEGEVAFQPKVTGSDLGCYLKNMVE